MEKEWYWSRFADDFEAKNNYVVGESDIKIVNDSLSEIENMRTSLELACGNGTYSKLLAPKSSVYYATDFSDEMLSVAKRELLKFPNVKISKQNCFNLSFGKDSFDTVFMANLLHVIANPLLVLKEAKRVMKKNSRIIIISYTTDGMKLIDKIFMIYRYLKTYGKPSPTANKLNKTQAEQLLLDSGFTIEKSSLIGKKSKAILIIAKL